MLRKPSDRIEIPYDLVNDSVLKLMVRRTQITLSPFELDIILSHLDDQCCSASAAAVGALAFQPALNSRPLRDQLPRSSLRNAESKEFAINLLTKPRVALAPDGHFPTNPQRR